MNPERWSRLSELFESALAMAPQARADLLARIGREDDALRAELEALLQASAAAGDFLDRPPATGPEPVDDTLPPGTLLGHWRILRLIGHGGMGTVHEAERAAGDFAQRAAIKVTRREAAAQIGRFNAERQLLARFDHPGIARLLDGGLAPDGRPYFVMEYIDGQPITAWCDQSAAGLERRLDLFLQVCDAVSYAHRHLVVHRDIKPANVMVDDSGRARLLDFGIAKPLDATPGNAGSPAETQALLTPDYAAPEQLAGEPVTTATDVHALGVLLFELLTGRRPWTTQGQPFARAMRQILERTAARPSSAAAASGQRPVDPRLLRGDWDAIVAKCLRKEPRHRYPSVEALERDVRRAQRGDPVTARADAKLYIFGRLLRRYRWAAAAVFAIIAVLSAGIAATTWQANRARQEAARATATRDFLIGIFRANDPRIAQDKPRGQITARELLDASVARIDEQFRGDPASRIELLGVTAEIYGQLEEHEQYEREQRRHLEAAREHYGPEHPIVIAALLDEADRANERLDEPRAIQLLDQLDELIREGGHDRSAMRARWWLLRGKVIMGDSSKRDEQLMALHRAADLFEEVAPRHPARVTAVADIGTVHNMALEFDQAGQWYERAIAIAGTVEDRNDSELATIYGNLGLNSLNNGDFIAADQAYARAEQVIVRTYGKASRAHWMHAANRARAAHLGGDRDRAAALFAALLQDMPPDSQEWQATEAREKYAGCLAAEGREREAIPILEQLERAYRRSTAYDFELPRVQALLGDAYDRAGRTSEARVMLKSTYDIRTAQGSADGQPVLLSRERWGRFLLSQGDLDGAGEQFDEVIAQARGRRLSHIALAQAGSARVALARGDLDKANAMSSTAVATFDDVSGFRDVRMGPYLWLVRSDVLEVSGDLAAALAFAERALEARRRYDAPEAASIVEAEARVRTLRERIRR